MIEQFFFNRIFDIQVLFRRIAWHSTHSTHETSFNCWRIMAWATWIRFVVLTITTWFRTLTSYGLDYIILVIWKTLLFIWDGTIRIYRWFLVMKSLLNEIRILTFVVRTWRSFKLNVFFYDFFICLGKWSWRLIIDWLNIFIQEMHLRWCSCLSWIWQVCWIFQGWISWLPWYSSRRTTIVLWTSGTFTVMSELIDTSFLIADLLFEGTHLFAFLWFMSLPLRTYPRTSNVTWVFIFTRIPWVGQINWQSSLFELLPDSFSNSTDFLIIFLIPKILLTRYIFISILISHFNRTTFKPHLFLTLRCFLFAAKGWYLHNIISIRIQFSWRIFEQLPSKSVL